MSRRDNSYDVVYVSRPREVVYELPRRAATLRHYGDRSYAMNGYTERHIRHRDNYARDSVLVSEPSDDYGSDIYYLPSRGSRNMRDSVHKATDHHHRGPRFDPEPERYQTRRRLPVDHTGRRPASPNNYPGDRGDRGRRADRRESPARRLRSAMRGSRNESPEAQQRARARSVSFREKEASKHDAGNQKHERPGHEARAVGQYLRRDDDDDDLASETYAIRRTSRRYS